MPIKVGDQLPETNFRIMTDNGPEPRSTSEIFKGKKVVLFGVPGAFTPTCHRNHLPSFLKNADQLKDRGIDTIAVTAVNDPFVMKAWAESTGAGGAITFLSDGSAEFAKATGLDLDLSARGLGVRNQRFSMLVDDGQVKILNIEDAPGTADKTSAEALIAQL